MASFGGAGVSQKEERGTAACAAPAPSASSRTELPTITYGTDGIRKPLRRSSEWRQIGQPGDRNLHAVAEEQNFPALPGRTCTVVQPVADMAHVPIEFADFGHIVIGQYPFNGMVGLEEVRKDTMVFRCVVVEVEMTSLVVPRFCA